MARSLTAKQRRFVGALLGPANGNQTLAARIAGYAGDDLSLAVQGCRNMQNENIKRLLKEKCEAMLETSLETYAAALSATERKTFLTKDGKIIYGDPQPLWKVKMEAAKRVIQYCEQSSADEDGSKVDIESTTEETELQQKIDCLSSTDRALIGRTCVIATRPVWRAVKT